MPTRCHCRNSGTRTGHRAGPGAPLDLAGLGLAFAAAGAALLVQQVLPTVSPLLVAIVLGVALTNLWTIPESFAPGMKVAAKRLLRLGIVVLGLQLALATSWRRARG